MADILKKVHRYISDLHMIAPGSHVVAGISGGADSMCLLFVLLSLKEKLALKLTAVHINHGLRGAAADGDEAFVKAWCEKYEVDFVSFRTDIRARAKADGISEEECGRLFRYECFEKVRVQRQADVIAVAHHQDDLAETVIFNMVRGSNIKGMAGISPVRGHIIRPLLVLRRCEIEALLLEQQIDYRTDDTNFEEDYTRNKIRLKVLPYLTKEINPKAVEHITAAAGAALEASNYIERQAAAAWDRVSVGAFVDKEACEGEKKLSALRVQKLLEEDIVIQKALVCRMIKQMTGQLKDITAQHIQSILALSYMRAGKEVHLPYHMAAQRTKTDIILTRRRENEAEAFNSEVCMAVEVPSVCRIRDADKTIILEFEKTNQIPVFFKNPCTKCFDYDKINGGLLLRHRQPEDYMEIRGGKKKTVARIMIDSKVPKAQRERLWVLADGHHILWIPAMDGGRISEHYKIDETTKQVLMIKIKGESENGRQD